MTTATSKPPVSFWIIAIVALVWNLMGIMAYITTVTMTPETLQSIPAEQQQFYTDIPKWVVTAFAIAVWGSTLGCILLLLRKKFATPVFAVSFAAIIFQMTHSLFMTKMLEVSGAQGAIMPVMIIVVGGFLVWYSRNAAKKGWIS